MGGQGKPLCFVCLKSINNDGHQKSGTIAQSELFENFASVLSGYLQLSFLSSSPRLSDDQSSSVQNGSVFCEKCAQDIRSIWEVYKEFQKIERRLSAKLGEVGEMMLKKLKLGDVLSKSLTEQLMQTMRPKGRRISGCVEKVRNVMALKSALKGKEVELNHGKTREDEDFCPGEEARQGRQYIKVEIFESNDDDSTMMEDDCLLDDDDEDNEFLDDQEIAERGHEQVGGAEQSSDHLSSSSSDPDWSEKSPSAKPRTKKRKMTLTSTSSQLPVAVGYKKQQLEPSKPETVPNMDCNECGTTFNNMSLFARHLLTHEDKEPVKGISCHFCWMTFALPQSYECHLKTRHEQMELIFPCEDGQCEELSFSSTQELNDHLGTHSETVYICSTCNWGFLNPHMMELHELVHLRSVKGNFPCSKCSSCLHGFPKFRDHYNFRHGAKLKLYKCPKCSETCVTRVNLKTHMRSHGIQSKPSPRPSSYQSQICKLCGVVFKGSEGKKLLLSSHMKIKHNKVKSQSVKHACSICSETFISERGLERHMKSEHQTTKTSCPVCNKEYASRTALKNHVKTIHPKDPEEKHLCPHCGQTYPNLKYLQQHIRHVHKAQAV